MCTRIHAPSLLTLPPPLPRRPPRAPAAAALPGRQSDVLAAEAVRSREEEERGNAMKALENRTKDSKREMDIMEALDEMRSLKAR